MLPIRRGGLLFRRHGVQCPLGSWRNVAGAASQGDGVVQDVAVAGEKRPTADYVDVDAEQRFKLPAKARKIEERGVLGWVDEEVDVGISAALAASNRSEGPDVGDPVPPGPTTVASILWKWSG